MPFAVSTMLKAAVAEHTAIMLLEILLVPSEPMQNRSVCGRFQS